MIAIGLLISVLLLPGPVMIADGVGLGRTTLLLVGAMSILVGVQSITFGFIARSYAQRNGILPEHARYDKLLSGVTLEHMLVLKHHFGCCRIRRRNLRGAPLVNRGFWRARLSRRHAHSDRLNHGHRRRHAAWLRRLPPWRHAN